MLLIDAVLVLLLSQVPALLMAAPAASDEIVVAPPISNVAPIRLLSVPGWLPPNDIAMLPESMVNLPLLSSVRSRLTPLAVLTVPMLNAGRIVRPAPRIPPADQ